MMLWPTRADYNLPTLVLDFMACCTLFRSVISTIVIVTLNLDATFEKYLFTPEKGKKIFLDYLT